MNGAKVDEASLGTVPSANTANTANTAGTANALSPLEATHLVGAPGEPGFENGSENLASGTPIYSYNPVGFYKDHEGIVHLQGIAKVGTEGKVFTLPPGFRPASGKLLVLSPLSEYEALIAGSNVSSGGIDLSGHVLGLEGEPIVLDNIAFKAES